MKVTNSDGDEVSSPLRIDRYEPLPAVGFDKPFMGYRPADTSPFNRPSSRRECLFPTPGVIYTLRAVNLPVGQTFELGIFKPDSDIGTRIGKFSVKVNQNGVGRFDFKTPTDLEPGIYYISLPLYPGSDSIWEMGAYACFVIG